VQRTVGCLILNQLQQSSSMCFGQSANPDLCCYSASTSEDVTMATWGGSTAGNLESIDEDDDDDDDDDNEDDDDDDEPAAAAAAAVAGQNGE